MYRYAVVLYNGEGVKVDKNKASEYFKQAAYNKHAESMYKYAMMIYTGDGVDVDKVEASEYFKQAARERIKKKLHITSKLLLITATLKQCIVMQNWRTMEMEFL